MPEDVQEMEMEEEDEFDHGEELLLGGEKKLIIVRLLSIKIRLQSLSYRSPHNEGI